MRNTVRKNNQYGTVYDIPNLDTNAFRQAAMKDPQFAWGELLGNALSGMYAQNYNNRGINKAVDKALETYGINPVTNDQAALQQVQQNMLQQGNGSIGVGDMDALNNVRQNMGLGVIQPAVSVGDAQPQDPQQITAQLAQMPGAGIMAQENDARSIGNFDMNTALANARRQMIKDGRTPYQIEMAMEQLQPHFQKMQDDNYRLQAERIMAELGATDENGKRLLSDNEYKQRIVDLATQYGDIGKAAANVYGKDIITGQQRWNAQQQEAKENRHMKNMVALKDMDAARQIAVARERAKLYGNAGGNPRGLFGNRANGANAKSLLDSAEFKYMANNLKEIGEIPEEDRTAEQKQFYRTYKPIHDSIINQSLGSSFGVYGVGQNQPSRTGAGNFNPNDYNQAVPFFKGFAKKYSNWRKEDLAGYIRQQYGLKPDDTSNEFVESIIREI